MRRVITIATISVGLALVCASFLGFAATVFWFFDLLNHFRVQYLIVGIGGILIALLLRSKWSLVAFSAFVFFFANGRIVFALLTVVVELRFVQVV